MKAKKRLRLAGRERQEDLARVRPLEPAMRAILDELAAARGWPTTEEPARLGAAVAALSAVYNSPEKERVQASSPEAMAARLLFSFPRDVPKSAAALRELVQRGRLAGSPERPLRVLDLGTGLGATTWGLARLLAPVHLVCTWVERDAAALALGSAIVERVRDRGLAPGIRLDLEARKPVEVSGYRPEGRFDVILVGQMLSELDRAEDEEERVARHARRLATWLGALAPEGVLAVIEPALRERTRHLHAVRDRLLAEEPAARVVYPCLHDEPCPALRIEREWCHDEVAIDLPPWLEPVARAAGLRWQGLSFAALVLERAARTELREAMDASEARVVSDPLDSKGQREAFVCGPVALEAAPAEDGRAAPRRVHALRPRVTRLERDAAPASFAWDGLQRYDRLRFRPALTLTPAAAESPVPRIRLPPGAVVERAVPPLPASRLATEPEPDDDEPTS